MRNTVKSVDKIFAFLTSISFIAFIGAVLIQIFSRTFLPRTPAWTEEISRYFFIYSVAFASGLAVRNNSYVAVDILVSHIPENLKKSYYVVLHFFLGIFALFFEIKCVFKFAFLKARMVSTALEIPMQYIYFALVILFGVLTLSYFCQAVLILKDEQLPEGGAA